MANIIRAIVALFWLIASGFIGFLAYIVVQTEGNPRAIWGWMVMCGFTFLSVTFLAYTVIFSSPQHDEKHHPGNA